MCQLIGWARGQRPLNPTKKPRSCIEGVLGVWGSWARLGVFDVFTESKSKVPKPLPKTYPEDKPFRVLWLGLMNFATGWAEMGSMNSVTGFIEPSVTLFRGSQRCFYAFLFSRIFFPTGKKDKNI